jgi:hypothetical protein
MIVISSPSLVYADGKARLSAHVTRAGSRDTLWFEVAETYGAFLCDDRLDAFLLAALPLAMMLGEDLHADASVSEKLLENVRSKIAPLLREMEPRLNNVAVAAAATSAAKFDTAAAVVTGFSGGVDSFCVLRDKFLDAEPGTSGRVTHFVFNDVGSHGPRGGLSEARYKARLAHVTNVVVGELGRDLVTITSNMDDFVPLSFEQSHTLRNAAAMLTLQKFVSQYLYASAYHLRDCRRGPSNEIALFDPILLPLFSTESTEILSVGCEYHRTEKTARIADLALAQRYLHVCAADLSAENCSKCAKCLRTLLTLELLGKLDSYRSVFDLDVYRRHRPLYMATVLQARKPLDREIIALADKVGFVWPWRARMVSKVYPARLVAFTAMIGRRLWDLAFLEGGAGRRATVGRWMRRIGRKIGRI